MKNLPNTVQGMTNLIITQVEANNDKFELYAYNSNLDKFELYETDNSFHMIGQMANALLTYTYKSSPDLETAIQAFAVMGSVFAHYGANDTLTQEWFEYNSRRWAMSRNIKAKEYNKLAKKLHKQYA